MGPRPATVATFTAAAAGGPAARRTAARGAARKTTGTLYAVPQWARHRTSGTPQALRPAAADRLQSDEADDTMWNLPNSLTFLRILMVPLLVVVLLTRFSGSEFWGLGIFLLAALTDSPTA